VHSGLEGARPAALADDLQTTVPAIYQLHYRANQLLRDCMNKETH
jgi:RNA polymerase sigma-70 factor, ECF subfamily